MLLKNKFSNHGVYDACRRIIVIGDIHGDIKKFVLDNNLFLLQNGLCDTYENILA